MKAKSLYTGLALALAVAIGLGLPESASADRGRGGHHGAFVGHSGKVFVGGGHRVVVGAPGTVFVGGGRFNHHARTSVGIVVGVPLGWGWPWYGGYYPPYYGGYYGPYGYPGYGYYPPAAVSTSPPVYVEKGAPDAAADQYQSPSGYWYYCRDANGYYPYVKQCPGGWERVAPTPER